MSPEKVSEGKLLRRRTGRRGARRRRFGVQAAFASGQCEARVGAHGNTKFLAVVATFIATGVHCPENVAVELARHRDLIAKFIARRHGWVFSRGILARLAEIRGAVPNDLGDVSLFIRGPGAVLVRVHLVLVCALPICGAGAHNEEESRLQHQLLHARWGCLENVEIRRSARRLNFAD